jgi:hypothetical protein
MPFGPLHWYVALVIVLALGGGFARYVARDSRRDWLQSGRTARPLLLPDWRAMWLVLLEGLLGILGALLLRAATSSGSWRLRLGPPKPAWTEVLSRGVGRLEPGRCGSRPGVRRAALPRAAHRRRPPRGRTVHECRHARTPSHHPSTPRAHPRWSVRHAPARAMNIPSSHRVTRSAPSGSTQASHHARSTGILGMVGPPAATVRGVLDPRAVPDAACRPPMWWGAPRMRRCGPLGHSECSSRRCCCGAAARWDVTLACVTTAPRLLRERRS